MATELPKAYDPKSVESEANRVWTDEKLFHAEPTSPGQPYAIVIPPPNVTAALHLGLLAGPAREHQRHHAENECQ